MAPYRSWRGPALVVLLSLGAGLSLAYPFNPNPQSTQGAVSPLSYTVNFATASGVGSYLVNGSGFTLYFLVKDPGNGSSTCYGGCLTFWPPFYAGSKLTLPSGLKASDFGVASRTDGKLQTTYKGYPLYYYVKDTKPAEIGGEGDHGFYACCNVVESTSTSSSSA